MSSLTTLAHDQAEGESASADPFSQLIENDPLLDSLNQTAQQLLASDSTLYFKAKTDMLARLIEIKKYQEAIDYSASFGESYGQYLSPFERAKLYTALGTAFTKTNDLEGARKYLEKAIALNSSSQDKELVKLHAKLLANLGRIHWTQRRFDESEKAYDQSLELYFDIPLKESASDIFQTSRKFAINIKLRGKQDKALSVLNKALKVVRENLEDNELMLVQLYTDMGSIYHYSFGVEKSTDFYMKAKAILDKLPDDRKKIGNYYTLAFNLASQEDYEIAANYAIKGIEIAKNIIGPKSAWVVSGYYTLCIAYLESGKVELAEKEAFKALAICNEAGLLSTLTGTQILNILGSIKERQGDFQQAITFLIQAENTLEKKWKTALESWYPPIGNNLALNFLKANRLDESLERYQKCLVYNTINFDNMDALSSPEKAVFKSIDWAFTSLKGKSLALERKYDQTGDAKFLFAALSSLNAADVVITQIKQLSTSINDQLGNRPEVVTVLRSGVRVCHKLYLETQEEQYLEKAFHFSEAAKSNLILSNLQESLALNMTKIPEGILTANDDALKDITYYEQELFKARELNDTISINNLKLLLPNLRLKADSIKRVINDIDPNFFVAKFSNEYEKIETIQEDLKKHEAVLNYSIGDSSLFIFEISKGHLAMHKNELSAHLPELINQFIDEIQEPSFDKQAAENYLKLSKAIKDYLIPQSVQLENVKKITIIPDDYISLIPFEAIATTAKGAIRDHSSLNYLIDKYTITYANSATLWARQESSKSGFKTSEVLAFAPVFDQNGIDAVSQEDIGRSQLSPLAWTGHEVNEISKHFETRLMLANEANESNFRKSASTYPIIHIASHGLLNQKNTHYSKLIFSPFNTDSVNDGFLNTQELYALKIPAEMVVLSACNTAVGDIISGEGIISLANGFFYAGSKSLVMSLWVANDHSTASIIGDFYAGLAKGQHKGEALRNAKLKYLNDSDEIRAHPYYWAHLVVNGNNQPIKAQSSWTLYFFLIAIVGAVITMAAVRRKAAKR